MIVWSAIAIIAMGIFGAFIAAAFNWYVGFIEWLYSPDWAFAKLMIKIIIIAADILLLAITAVLGQRYAKLTTMTPIGEEKVELPSKTEEVVESVAQIRALAISANPSDWHMAILRADAQLEELLRYKGYEGATLAERLAVVDPYAIPSLDKIWSAHRLRNAIAHDPTAQHSQESIRAAILAYEQAFRELGYFHEGEEISPPDEIIRNA